MRNISDPDPPPSGRSCSGLTRPRSQRIGIGEAYDETNERLPPPMRPLPSSASCASWPPSSARSASDEERRAADWLAAELRAAGCRDVRVEEERAHGGYWWPLGLLNAAALLAAARGRAGRRRSSAALAAAAVYDDVSGGKLWFRRRALPHRPT